jgi:uncharacterized glyoxalase superfamily protein PhnB
MSEPTPYLAVHDARAAIDWYTRVLGAVVTVAPIVMPDGRIGHVELEIDGGAEVDRGPEDNPPVGRVAVLRDPSGHRWFLNQSLA